MKVRQILVNGDVPRTRNNESPKRNGEDYLSGISSGTGEIGGWRTTAAKWHICMLHSRWSCLDDSARLLTMALFSRSPEAILGVMMKQALTWLNVKTSLQTESASLCFVALFWFPPAFPTWTNWGPLKTEFFLLPMSPKSESDQIHPNTFASPTSLVPLWSDYNSSDLSSHYQPERIFK
jgi:hypothetical protein